MTSKKKWYVILVHILHDVPTCGHEEEWKIVVRTYHLLNKLLT